jgi:hypothetical protein
VQARRSSVSTRRRHEVPDAESLIRGGLCRRLDRRLTQAGVPVKSVLVTIVRGRGPKPARSARSWLGSRSTDANPLLGGAKPYPRNRSAASA